MTYYGYIVAGTMQTNNDKEPMLALILHTQERSIASYQYYHEKTYNFFGKVIEEPPEEHFKRFTIPLTATQEKQSVQASLVAAQRQLFLV